MPRNVYEQVFVKARLRYGLIALAAVEEKFEESVVIQVMFAH